MMEIIRYIARIVKKNIDIFVENNVDIIGKEWYNSVFRQKELQIEKENSIKLFLKECFSIIRNGKLDKDTMIQIRKIYDRNLFHNECIYEFTDQCDKITKDFILFCIMCFDDFICNPNYSSLHEYHFTWKLHTYKIYTNLYDFSNKSYNYSFHPNNIVQNALFILFIPIFLDYCPNKNDALYDFLNRRHILYEVVLNLKNKEYKFNQRDCLNQYKYSNPNCEKTINNLFSELQRLKNTQCCLQFVQDYNTKFNDYVRTINDFKTT